MPDFAVILPAAGSSTRFGGGRNKLFEDLCGRPVIEHTLGAFLGRKDVAMVVVAAPMPQGWTHMPAGLKKMMGEARVRVCAGGASRAESVRNALAVVPESVQWVAVHDAARPLVSGALIDRTLAAAVEHGAAVGALPVALTIKEAQGPLPAKVVRTVPRQRLWAMQTPQIVKRSELRRGFAECPIPLTDVTDDVQLVELIGGEVWLVMGEERNLKITTAMDLRIAEMVLGERQ